MPGRLQDAIEHFNGCILANETYEGVRESNEEAVARLRLLQQPMRGWRLIVYNLLPVLILLVALSQLLVK